jgi:hypothetical protein
MRGGHVTQDRQREQRGDIGIIHKEFTAKAIDLIGKDLRVSSSRERGGD